MKRILCLVLGFSVVTGVAAAQSLGEVARKLRQQKKPGASKVYTEENLPTSAVINIGANAAAEKEQTAMDKDKKEATSTKTTSPATANANPPAAKAAPASTEDVQKKMAQWKARFDEQRKSISLLERELDVLQRENKQRTAVFYADAGAQLRDSRQWAEDQNKYQAAIEAKDKELAGARQKLGNMKDEARKAGMPSSVSD